MRKVWHNNAQTACLVWTNQRFLSIAPGDAVIFRDEERITVQIGILEAFPNERVYQF